MTHVEKLAELASSSSKGDVKMVVAAPVGAVTEPLPHDPNPGPR